MLGNPWEVLNRTRAEVIALGRLVVEASYVGVHRVGGMRRWLETGSANSYDDPAYSAELHVLEGSPPKGFVIYSPFMGAVAISGHGGFEHKFYRGLVACEREKEYQKLARKFQIPMELIRKVERFAIETNCYDLRFLHGEWVPAKKETA